MNLSDYNILKGNKTGSILTSEIKSTLKSMDSTPMSNLRGSVQKVQVFYQEKQDSYDAMSLAFSNVQEQYDDAFEAKLSIDSNVSFESIECEVDDDTAISFAAGIAQAAARAYINAYINEERTNEDMLKAEAYSGIKNIQISDAQGVQFLFYIDMDKYLALTSKSVFSSNIVWTTCIDGNAPVLRREGSRNFMSHNLKSTTYHSNDVVPVLGTSNIMSDIADIWDRFYAAQHGSLTPVVRSTGISFLRDLYYYTVHRDPGTLTYQYMISGIHSAIAHAPFNTHTDTLRGMLSDIYRSLWVPAKFRDKLKSWVSLAQDLVNTSEINATLSQLCEAVMSSKPVQMVSDMYEKAKDGTKVVRAVVRNAMDSLRVGGIRGLIKYIINYIRGGTSIVDENGCLKFTNNASFIPSEFIGGLLGTIISGALTALGLLVTAFNRVLGIAITAAGAIVGAIWNSIQGTHDDVYASAVMESDADDIPILPYLPISLFRLRIVNHEDLVDSGSMEYHANKLYLQLLAAYKDLQGPFEIAVPGGCLIVAPEQMETVTNEDGESESYPRVFGAEFHPAAIIYQGKDNDSVPDPSDWKHPINDWLTGAGFQASEFIFNTQGIGTGLASTQYCINLRKWCSVKQHVTGKIWQYVLNHPGEQYNPIVNGANAHLSSLDDALLRKSIMISIGLFNLYLFEESNCFDALTYDHIRAEDQEPEWIEKRYLFLAPEYEHSSSSSDQYKNLLFFATRSLILFNRYGYVNFATPFSWREIVKGCDFLSKKDDEYIPAFACYEDRYDEDYVEDIVDFGPIDLHAKDFNLHYQEMGYGISKWTVDTAVPLPGTFKYNVTLPMYNASTYWTWVIIVSAVVATVTAIAVVATIKFKKFAKNKRAKNVAKFNEAQSTYQEAVNGRESYIDENGNLKYREFDPNSEEGKAKIQSAYKDYKKTAFTNNMWAKVIGGTRYDITTFYGEAEDPGDTSGESGALDGFNATELSGLGNESVEATDGPTLVDTKTYQYIQANSDPLVTNNTIATEISVLEQQLQTGINSISSDLAAILQEKYPEIYKLISGRNPIINPEPQPE